MADNTSYGSIIDMLDNKNLIRYYNSSTHAYIQRFVEGAGQDKPAPESLYFTVVEYPAAAEAGGSHLTKEGILYVNGINYSSSVKGVKIAEDAAGNKQLVISTVNEHGVLIDKSYNYVDINKEELDAIINDVSADIHSRIDVLAGDVSALAEAFDNHTEEFEQYKEDVSAYNAATFVHDVEVAENFAQKGNTTNAAYGATGTINAIDVDNTDKTNPKLAVVLDNKTLVKDENGVIVVDRIGLGMPEFRLAKVGDDEALEENVLTSYKLQKKPFGVEDASWVDVPDSAHVDIYKDQLIKKVELIDLPDDDPTDPSKRNTVLRITWNTVDASDDTSLMSTDIDLNKFFDIYTVAEDSSIYMSVEGYKFNVNIDNIIAAVDSSLDIPALKQRVYDLSTNVDALDASVSAHIAATDASLADLSTFVDEMDTSVKAHFDETDAAVDEVSTRLDDVSARVEDKLDQLFDSMIWHVL